MLILTSTNSAIRAALSLMDISWKSCKWVVAGEHRGHIQNSSSMMAIAQAHVEEHAQSLKKHESMRMIVEELKCIQTRVTRRCAEIKAIEEDKSWFGYWFPTDTSELQRKNVEDIDRHKEIFRTLLKLQRIDVLSPIK